MLHTPSRGSEGELGEHTHVRLGGERQGSGGSQPPLLQPGKGERLSGSLLGGDGSWVAQQAPAEGSEKSQAERCLQLPSADARRCLPSTPALKRPGPFLQRRNTGVFPGQAAQTGSFKTLRRPLCQEAVRGKTAEPTSPPCALTTWAEAAGTGTISPKHVRNRRPRYDDAEGCASRVPTLPA